MIAAMSIKEAKTVLRKFLEMDDKEQMENMLEQVREAILTLLGYSPRQLIDINGHRISLTDLQTDIRSLAENFAIHE